MKLLVKKLQKIKSNLYLLYGSPNIKVESNDSTLNKENNTYISCKLYNK